MNPGLSLHRGGGWVGLATLLVPADIRHQFRGELEAERVDMKGRGVPRWRMNLATAGSLLLGIAQHVPLSRNENAPAPQPGAAERCAAGGWLAWRTCGVLLFASYALSNGWLALAGAALLATTFGCVGAIAWIGREPYDPREVRLLNGVFGGLLAVLAVTFVAGVAILPLLGIAALFESALVGGLAVKALVFTSLLFTAAVCASGWVPREWEPQRMVRV